ncbi:MAG: hypothetical protein SPE97_03940, partial [Hallerella succinigenes]
AQPEYWVPYTETVLRATSLDSSIVAALRKEDGPKLRELCQHLAMTESDAKLQKVYLDATKNGDIVQNLLAAAEEYCPKYLMGWRDITNATNLRTMIFSVIPFRGAGNTLVLAAPSDDIIPKYQACLLANMSAMVLDFGTRFKVGGSHLNLFITKQLPVLPPSTYTDSAINYIVPRVFALTYTATDIVEWARALWNDASVDLRKLILAQHKDLPTGTDIETLAANDFDPASIPPIVFEDAHRAKLRTELDAYFAKLYGLSRRDLEYILDPKTVMGDDYPSETFRVLRDAELAPYGEYRTQRLVLEAWDKMN